MIKTRSVPKHFEPENVTFSIFTEKEIKDISVLQIVTPLTLDSLGHPILGGLYDNRLGPCTDRSAPCGTCNKNITLCPGHFGFIDLPVPCENPLFHKVIGTILRYSCLSCHRLQITEVTRKKIQALKEQNGEDVIQMSVIKLILEEVKMGKGCLFCKASMDKIQVLANRILMVTRRLDKSITNQKNKIQAMESKYINPSEAKNYLREIWTNEEDLIRIIAPVLDDIASEYPTDAFFFQVIPVPPPNVRPVNYLNGRVLENPQTTVYKNILTNALVMNHLIRVVQKKGDTSVLVSKEAKEFYDAAKGKTPIEKLNNCWEDLQSDVNGLLSKDPGMNREGIGLKQIIEKKEGIIRQHMMGKRVNFAARSVITPDPNLDVGEVGIPEVFAKKLTFPVPVTPWNVEQLRQLIKNGPEVHPGAVLVEMEDGSIKRINPENKTQQESLLKILLTPHNQRRGGFQGVKIVHRHLQNGDILLLNRQPTLHKPSIMAHRARILKGEKTLRLHYANCKAYNADFDGDEMNAHFPQDEVARSEGYNIAEVAQQYLVPKDGTPLSGLIQDHMIAGVRLSLRGRFFGRMDYHQLVFQALSNKTDEITLLPPSILKPQPLWSGKQILSTVLINIIPKGKQLINLTASSKISARAWQKNKERPWKAGGTPFKNQNTMTEAEVIIREGELLCGILDKTHYGATPYGLVHCVYELYGGRYAITLLSSFAKLFTRFLQQEGFTLGVHDILTVRKADKSRKKIIQESRQIGKQAIANALEIPVDSASVEEMAEMVEERCAVDPKFRQIIDRSYKSSLDSFTNAINKCCLPAGLVCKFPENNLQLMVQSGAKGSTVNTMQISCLLGQIELEGKRPPVMISGKSLPSFTAFEFTPRAGGFIDGRFMTGIQPQEFFFHCMAGREGLIDTAVKTSRSGYLQRCLIKHLEGLHVGYDLTVRNSDQSVIQFLYGEDGMDIFKSQFFNEKQMQFLQDNAKCIIQKDILHQLEKEEELQPVEEYRAKLQNWIKKNGSPLQKEKSSAYLCFAQSLKEKYGKEVKRKKIEKLWRETKKSSDLEQILIDQLVCPDPINSVFQSDHYFGTLNERLDSLMTKFTEGKKKKEKKQFEKMFKLKGMQSMCAPGEPVGLLAAQSVGEPSTQMTLNTFHFAGRGEMNVTLGIPRLREILMMASKNIKTPCMEIPFKSVDNLEERARELRKLLTRVVVGDVLEKIDVTVNLDLNPVRQHRYTLTFQFLPSECYNQDYLASIKSILKHMKKKFFREMFIAIAKVSKTKSNLVSMEQAPKTNIENEDSDDEVPKTKIPSKSKSVPKNDGDSSEDEVEDEEDAKLVTKYRDQQEDQDPEDEEEKKDVESDEEIEGPEPDYAEDQSTDNTVLEKYNFANEYKEDRAHHWCKLTFSLPMEYKKLDLTAILRDVAAKSVIWETPNIKRAITYVKDHELMMRTDGINVGEMCKYHDLLQLDRLYCNDIHKMAETYGIEAASKIIVKEVKDVFNVYGIKVDPRHLSLIADYMTFHGTFEPLSRRGMETSHSPLQQMSFESSLQFLKGSTIMGKKDDLQNPSSSLMLGKPCNTGTGSFKLLHNIPKLSV
ncbi:DNA-directed RNA polymerase I subunit RPA1 [Anthonomus grandis grandis]|uniref:DNA-directed RNA polymerase I subunit RPA1 n=1 Tax=Anthonomus grandis grandis TaxID=2921223 RepID=UPI0021664AAB|nr:DNA-directed RNA polymerase I subunit RPA1 [Anthonomus grandis grandis]